MKAIKFQFILLAIYFALPVFSTAQNSTKKIERPNIIIIISDDHAYQAISAYGSKLMNTPNIDRIAKEGVRFDRAYVTNSICGPSRAAILTGKYSHKNGFKDNESSVFNGNQDSFIKQLHNGGYQTAWIGKWHLESIPQGFDFWQILPDQGQYYNPDFKMMDGSKKRIEGYVTNVIENQSEDWLDKRDKTKPFCLVIGHKATHRVWLPDTTDLGRFDQVTFPLPHNFYDTYNGRNAAKVQDMNIAQTMLMGYDLKMFGSEIKESNDGNFSRMNIAQRNRIDNYYKPIEARFNQEKLTGNALTEWKFQRYIRDYLSTATSLDRNIGLTLDYLDKHNLTKNTVVIYLSDQGFYLGEHGWFDKRWIYEESFRTPMIMKYPGIIKPGQVSNHFVMNIDIAPTILDVAQIDVPKDLQGISMLPALKNKKDKGRQVMYYHYYENGEHSVSPHFGIRTKRFKLIRFYKRVSGWELYDLQKDPNEMDNKYEKKEYKAIAARLFKEMIRQVNKFEDMDAKKILEDKLNSTK